MKASSLHILFCTLFPDAATVRIRRWQGGRRGEAKRKGSMDKGSKGSEDKSEGYEKEKEVMRGYGGEEKKEERKRDDNSEEG